MSVDAPLGARVLRFLAGLALLIALDLLGGLLVGVMRVPVPGSVVGMLLLTALIRFGVVPLDLLRPAAELLARHLALLLVPAGVALIAYVGLVRHDFVAIVAAGLASLIAVLTVVGVIVQRMERAP